MFEKGERADVAVQTCWEALARMKYDAVAFSSEDIPDIATLPAPLKPGAVCANLTDKDGKAPLPPYVVLRKKLANGRNIRVGIIGVLGMPPFNATPNPGNSPEDQPWRVGDPTEAVKKVMPEVQKKADIVILIYSGIREPAKRIVQAVPGIHLLVVGRELGEEGRFEKLGDTVVVQNTDRGRLASLLGLTIDKDNRITQTDLRNIAMDSTIPDDPAMVPLVESYRQKTAVSVQQTFTPTAEPTGQYAGSFTCQSCHPNEYKQWRTTAHSHAMETLELKGDGISAKRPDCVKCHSVGFGQPGGYDISRPLAVLRGVGCEECHGPAAAHVKARRSLQPDTSKLVRYPAQAVCLKCHDKDNSPKFEYATYLPKVQHAKDAPTPRQM
ncbi:MAG TPA: multiheme c-type cytochrome [Armatimonadota bacterium]|nr:multiheme c-type cytochrome [Armatimonadota bacterium]